MPSDTAPAATQYGSGCCCSTRVFCIAAHMPGNQPTHVQYESHNTIANIMAPCQPSRRDRVRMRLRHSEHTPSEPFVIPGIIPGTHPLPSAFCPTALLQVIWTPLALASAQPARSPTQTGTPSSAPTQPEQRAAQGCTLRQTVQAMWGSTLPASAVGLG